MNEIEYEIVNKIIMKIVDDCKPTTDEFIIQTYNYEDFDEYTSFAIFHNIINFLPNTKHNGKPFVMSVAYSKSENNYTLIINNPKRVI